MAANNNNNKRTYDSAMPIIDEGWWESVLAEERQPKCRCSALHQGSRSSSALPLAKSTGTEI